MAEVGLVVFARMALAVAKEALPERRSRFSKRLFTQPQLLACLLVMRREGWTFRRTEIRLAEHGELRSALELATVPDFTTLYRFLRRLSPTQMDRALATCLEKAGAPGAPATVAIDGTGLRATAVSAHYQARRGNELRPRWLKWLVTMDLERRLILAQEAKPGPANDVANFRPLLSQAAERVPVTTVLADAEFDARKNHEHAQAMGVLSVIPPKRNRPGWKPRGRRKELTENFPRELYARRSLVESLFSAVKRRLSDLAPGRLLDTQILQALLLGIAYDIDRLRRARPSQRL